MELKPCPFCGGEAVIRCLLGAEYIAPIHKKNCVVRPDTWLISSKPIKHQKQAWNRRVKEDA
jgi:hypothetical protein